MLPHKEVRLRLGDLLAADDATLAPALAANKIALIKAAFAYSESIALADLDLADFDGSTPIAGAVGAQLVGIDPVTLEQIITIKDPVGGYRWITTGMTNLPQTIYGAALLNDAGDAILGLLVEDTPITLNAVGQQIDLGSVQMRFVAQPIG